jgi:acyl-CoA synthetase (AMP-forming)/AMP-acid ligase II
MDVSSEWSADDPGRPPGWPAQRDPDATALVVGDQRLTYRELQRRVNDEARHLWHHGVAPGSRVGAWPPQSIEYAVTLLAVLRIGATCNLAPAVPDDELRALLGQPDVANPGA